MSSDMNIDSGSPANIESRSPAKPSRHILNLAHKLADNLAAQTKKLTPEALAETLQNIHSRAVRNEGDQIPLKSKAVVVLTRTHGGAIEHLREHLQTETPHTPPPLPGRVTHESEPS